VCVAANAQPDACAYGLICGGAACANAPVTGNGCPNFASVSTPLAWNPATANPRGAVTVAFAPRSTNDDTFCSGSLAFTYTVDLYAAPSTTFPAMIDLAQAGTFNYVRSDGQIIDLAMGAVRPASGYVMGLTNSNRNLRLVWTACATGITSLRAGFYANNGNANCATQMR